MNRNSFMNRPWVQKQIQRLAAHDDRQNEIVSVALEDPAFKNYAGYLQQMQMAAQKQARNRNLGLSRRKSDAAYNLTTERIKEEQRQADIGEKLGYGNIAVSGLLGLADYRNKKNRAGRIRSRTNMLGVK